MPLGDRRELFFADVVIFAFVLDLAQLPTVGKARSPVQRGLGFQAYEDGHHPKAYGHEVERGRNAP